MAATNFTPISLYYSSTASAVPTAGNLVAGELALNIADAKLYFKNSSNVVTLLASAASATATVSSVGQSFTGGLISVSGSPVTTSGTLALTIAGTSGGVPYFSSGTTWASSGALTQYGIVYGGGAGAAPVATAAGTTGQTLIATSGSAPSWGTLGVNGGGTGSSTLAANNVLLGNGTSALQVVAPGSNGNVLTSNGTTWTSAASSSTGSGGTTASGSVTLTSSSPGSQAITTTNYNQSVTLPDATTVTKSASVFHIRNLGGYPLRIKDNSGNVYGFLAPRQDCVVGLSDNSTAAGVWTVGNLEPYAVAVSAKLVGTLTNNAVSAAVTLDSTRTLFVFGGTSSTTTYAFVYDSSTNTCGNTTSVAATSFYPSAYAISSSSALVVYSQGANIAAVVLSITGSAITVNTPVTTTGTIQGYGTAAAGYSPWIACGSTYILRCLQNSLPVVRAFTVSGTVPTIGAKYDLGSAGTTVTTYAVTSSTFIAFFPDTTVTTVYAAAYSVSGTTLTSGSLIGVSVDTVNFRVLPASTSGRFWLVTSSSAVFTVTLLDMVGTTIGTSQSPGCLPGTWTAVNVVNQSDMAVCGNRLIVAGTTSTTTAISYNVLTDTAGTISAGTSTTHNTTTITLTVYPNRVESDSTTATFAYTSSSVQYITQISASTTQPVIVATRSTAYVSTAMVTSAIKTFDGQIPYATQQFVSDTTYYTVPSSSQTRPTSFTNGAIEFPYTSYSAITTSSPSRSSATNYYSVDLTFSPNILTVVECATV
jgi:hypothetical protein